MGVAEVPGRPGLRLTSIPTCLTSAAVEIQARVPNLLTRDGAHAGFRQDSLICRYPRSGRRLSQHAKAPAGTISAHGIDVLAGVSVPAAPVILSLVKANPSRTQERLHAGNPAGIMPAERSVPARAPVSRGRTPSVVAAPPAQPHRKIRPELRGRGFRKCIYGPIRS